VLYLFVILVGRELPLGCVAFPRASQSVLSLLVSLVYYAESIVRWFVLREKHCWMAADSVNKSKRTGRLCLFWLLVDL